MLLRRRTSLPRLASLVVLFLLPVSALAQECIGDFIDDFNDGVIAPLWIPSSYPPACAAPEETGGQLVLSRPSGCGDRSTIIMDDTLYAVCGDFDITVDYDLVAFPVPPNGELSVSLDIWGESHVAVMARYNRPLVGCNPYIQNYKAFIDNPDDCDPGVAWADAGSSPASGKFRAVRVGSTISLQYWDSAWVELKSGVFGTDCNVVVELWAGHGATYHTGGFDVRFDNLDVQSDDLTRVEESPLRPAWFLSVQPNPFNPTTTISFSIPVGGPVSLTVHDITGRLVATIAEGAYQPGEFTAVWDGSDDAGASVPSGIYFARLHAGEYTAVRKMVLLR